MRALGVICLAAALAGCVRLLPEPPPAPRIHPLSAAPITAARDPAPLVIGVARPNAPQAIAGIDVVWMREGAIGYAPRSVWSARAPDALQGLLVATIDAQDLVAAAIRIGEGPRADYDLRWEVRMFQVIEEGDVLEARLDASLKLIESRSRRVVAAREFARAAPLERRSEAVAVTTLQDLAANAAVEIGAWAAEAARVHAASLPSQPSAASSSK